MPPLRLAIIDDLSKKPDSSASDVRRRLNKPWHTIDRQLQALHMLEVLDCDEVAYGDQGKSRWLYSLADGIHPDVLNPDVWLESSPVSAAPLRSDASENSDLIYPYAHEAEFGEVSDPNSLPEMSPPPEPSGQLVPWDTCRTEGCTAGLWHPESQQLGYCAKCRKESAV